ncbi:hypothetical protein [Streptomyces axinellae]|uniref:4'-phosphopantetheinyl transferase N-terminal domain-containing protein n=1 Tax=Streptomyces axinellae TaxID=552788 RepID=A0ABP6D9J6_9ACTN
MRFGSRKGERHVIARQLLPSGMPGAECAEAGPGGGARSGSARRPGAEGSFRSAGERRRAVSRSGQVCARVAPDGADGPPVRPLCHQRGAPPWSASLTGSITHRQDRPAHVADGTADFTAPGPGTWVHPAPPRAVPGTPAARPGRTWWPPRRRLFDRGRVAVRLPGGEPGGGGSSGAGPGLFVGRCGPPDGETGARPPHAGPSHAGPPIRKRLVPTASVTFWRI